VQTLVSPFVRRTVEMKSVDLANMARINRTGAPCALQPARRRCRR
jgi:hypothetical protein